MNFEYFIAQKTTTGQSFEDGGDRNGTRPIINIAVLSIALGLAVMILAISIVTGFQNEIRSKVIGVGSHIQITNFDLDYSIETKPVSIEQDFYPHLDTVEGIRHIQMYATKAGIIKTKTEVQGVVLKGIGPDHDWEFFNKNMLKGTSFTVTDSVKTNQVLISKFMAAKLDLDIGNKFRMYFIKDNPTPLVRSFEVSGIYETGIEQIDHVMVMGDIKHIQKLNKWDESMVSGFDVTLDDYADLDRMDDFIYEFIGFDLKSTKITDKFMEIFGWLDLLDINVIVILVFAILVSGINMISTLLILILEKTGMIGLLKALGSSNWSIRKIFLYKAGYLIGKGLLWGNLIGIAACTLQLQFKIVTLPEESYYISVVPINLDLLHVAFLNLGTFVLCLFMLVIPSFVVTKITPVAAIRFN